jgi:hypothetical protein
MTDEFYLCPHCGAKEAGWKTLLKIQTNVLTPDELTQINPVEPGLFDVETIEEFEEETGKQLPILAEIFVCKQCGQKCEPLMYDYWPKDDGPIDDEMMADKYRSMLGDEEFIDDLDKK